MSEISELVLKGSFDRGAEIFFSGDLIRPGSVSALSDVCNELLEEVSASKNTNGHAAEFLRKVIRDSAEASGDPETQQALQLVAAQALTIISWMSRGIPGSSGMRLTAEVSAMSWNEKHGKGFIDISRLPGGVAETKKEGAPGFFWRGTEKIPKLGPNVAAGLIYDAGRFKTCKDRIVMYLMDHGYLEVKPGLQEATASGRVSTAHETFFMRDFLPGSFQTTSTGSGHFQGTKVDIKYVISGRGIQFNVRFDAEGRIDEVLAQAIKSGDWAIALPGHVDYMADIEELRFGDVSIDLDIHEAAGFCPSFDFLDGSLAGVKEAIAQKGKMAPYAGAKLGDAAYLFKTRDDAPPVRWIPSLKGRIFGADFFDVYSGLSSDGMKAFVQELLSCYPDTLSNTTHTAVVELLSAKTLHTAMAAVGCE